MRGESKSVKESLWSADGNDDTGKTDLPYVVVSVGWGWGTDELQGDAMTNGDTWGGKSESLGRSWRTIIFKRQVIC